jgi:hypothetical protein
VGLDCYLYHLADPEAKKVAVARYRERIAPLWNTEPTTPVEVIRERARIECATDEYGEYMGEQRIDVPSIRYPDHLFKVGYFRPSYNEGGFDHVMRDYGLPDLDTLFAVPEHAGEVHPDWPACKIRVDSALAALREVAASDAGCYSVCSVRDMHTAFDDTAAALAAFRVQLCRKRDPLMENYSSREGDFWLGDNPPKVRAVMWVKSHFGDPHPVLVYEAADRLKWYVEAMEVVAETVDWVLAQPDPEHYYFHWSG